MKWKTVYEVKKSNKIEEEEEEEVVPPFDPKSLIK